MEFSRQEHWSGLPFPSPGALPDPGTEPESLVSPTLAAEPLGKPSLKVRLSLIKLLLLLLSRSSRVRLCVTPPGSAVPGVLQERTLEWVAISFSSA